MAWLLCFVGLVITKVGYKEHREYLKGLGNGLSIGVMIIGITKLVQLMN